MSDKGKRYNDNERLVMRILDNHRGLENLITGLRLRELSDLCERDIKGIIAHLVTVHNKLILSEMGAGGGYYLLSSNRKARKAEVARYKKQTHRRAMSALMRMSVIKKAPPLVHIYQLTIDHILGGGKIKGLGQMISALVAHLESDPENHRQELEELKTATGPLFYDPKRLAEINQAAKKLTELTNVS